jgi:hypothetical protein
MLKILATAVATFGLLAGITLTQGTGWQIFGAKEWTPTPIHFATYGLVHVCLLHNGFDAKNNYEDIRWFSADSIIRNDGRDALGLHLEDEKNTGARFIILRTDQWFNPQIISHEAIHDMTNASDDSLAIRNGLEEWGCQIPVPYPTRDQ